MIEIRCDFCGAKTAKEFNHKVEIKPWYNPRVAGHVYHREFDCCEECAKAIEHRLIGIENNWLWHGKDPNRRYKNWDLSINKVEAIPKDQYENRLKADMIAMLTDIQLEIEEYDVIGNHSTGSYDADLYNGAYSDGMSRAASIVSEKIEQLKEQTNEQ